MLKYLPTIIGTIYCCSEIILGITRRSRETGDSRDANSLRVLWIVIVVSVWLGMQAHELWRDATLPFWTVSVGVVLFVFGIFLRWYSIIHLGRFFTVDVSIAKNHELIETGPYRFIRHPSYSGALLAFVGYGMVLQNWVSLLILIGPIGLAFLYRIHVEERALIQALGERYTAYINRTKRLVPFVY